MFFDVYLIPQILGGALDISIEVGHMNKLLNSGFTGCPRDLLGDGDEDIFELVVALKRDNNTVLKVFLNKSGRRVNIKGLVSKATCKNVFS